MLKWTCQGAPYIALTGETKMLGAEINILNWSAQSLGINH